ncbi:MAG TPA: LysM peptidoglycan-binding domain-containing protein [Pyrinomonadaceae bacterium]
MALAKLKITPRSDGYDVIEVLFNPTSYSISKPVNYTSQPRRNLNAPLLSFGGGGSRTLTLKLFFDVTERPVVRTRIISDVRTLTNKLVELTLIERDKERPPVCDISWGGAAPANSDFPFCGVVNNLAQEFTLFSSDGTPLRANVTISFLEFLAWEEDWRKTDPDFSTRVVRRDETLSSIAAEVYDDPRLWRVIADANSLDNPRRLEPGQVLHVPKLG